MFNKNAVTLFHHYIMSANIGDIKTCDSDIDYVVERITEANLHECADSAFSINIMAQYIKNQNDKAIGYLFKEKISGNAIGYAWVMRKGGDEIQYKIRNIDAFLFDVFVSNQYRGKRFVNVMISYIAQKEFRETDKIYLAVRVDNVSAIKAYERIGFETQEEKRFLRILKKNIPYYKL